MTGTQNARVTPEPAGEGDLTRSHAVLLRVLQVWLCLAVLGQLMYLAHWPMYVLGTAIPQPASLGVAFVRLGIYGGLAWGLLTGREEAWAGIVLEQFRTFLAFVAHSLLQNDMAMGSVYPAGWTQGLLSGALPFVAVLNVALGMGWRPGSRLNENVFALAQYGAVIAFLAGLWLRRQAFLFGVDKAVHQRVLLGRGLPIVLVISGVEALAVAAAR